MIERADVQAVADAMAAFTKGSAVEPEAVIVALASVFEDRIEDFDDAVAQAFFEACGIPHDEACLLASDFDSKVVTTDEIRARLEHLRAAIRAENISYGEIAELQGLAEHIEAGDVELLEWAGVPEFPDDDEA